MVTRSVVEQGGSTPKAVPRKQCRVPSNECRDRTVPTQHSSLGTGHSALIFRLLLILVLGLLTGAPGFAFTAINNATISQNTTWDPSGNPYIVSHSNVVEAGVRLTIQPGTVVKLQPGAVIQVKGNLRSVGTTAQPIIFTSWRDDAGYAPISDGTPPAPGDWSAIRIANDNGGSSSAIFDHCLVRYGGAISALEGSTLTVTNSKFSFSLNNAVECFGDTATITNNTFESNQVGVKIVHGSNVAGVIERSVTLRDNTFTGNQSYPVYAQDHVAKLIATGNTGLGNRVNGIYVQATIAVSNTFGPNPNFPYVFGGANFSGLQTDIETGATLTLTPGTIVKFVQGGSMEVRGSLIAQGSSTDKVVFTSLLDDTVGGHTNNVTGAPAPGDWGGIRIGHPRVGSISSPGSASLAFSVVRYGGANQTANLHVATPDSALAVTTSDITDAGFAGIAGGGSANVHVNNCILLRNQAFAASQPSPDRFSTMPDVDARHNWWGSVTGPRDSSDDRASGGFYNPNGQGNPVTDHVDYGGFLTVPGYFQPVTLGTSAGISSSGIQEIIAGQPFDITLTDLNADHSAGTPDTVVANVTVATAGGGTGDTLQLTLHETGNSTGVFTGTVQTVWGTPVSGNPILEVVGGDLITVTYTSPVSPSGGPQTVTQQVSVKKGSTATLAATPQQAAVGDTIHVTLVDRDLEQNPGPGNDTYNLPITTSAGDTLMLALTESTTAGTFQGDIHTVFKQTLESADTTDDVLQVKGGDTIAINYTDALDAQGRSNLHLSAPVAFAKGADGVLTIPVSIRSDQGLAITLVDDDLNLNHGAADHTTVQVQDITSGQTLPVTLNETGNDTGKFTSIVATVFDDGTTSGTPTILKVKGGDRLAVTYTDALDGFGLPNQVRTGTSKIQVGATAVITVPPAQIAAGDTIPLTVIDKDLDVTPGPNDDTLTVTVTTTRNGQKFEEVPVTLNETATPGKFQASLSTVFFSGSSAPAADGKLHLMAGDTIALVYNDELDAAGRTNQKTSFSSTVRTGHTGTFVVAEPSILAGESLHLTVTDADLAGSGTLPMTLTVGPSVSLPLTLQEQSSPAGTFTAIVPTAFADGTVGNNTLPVRGGDAISASYTDAIDAQGRGNTLHLVSIPVRAGADGTLTAPSSIKAGEDLLLTVTDTDRNLNQNAADTLTVTVRNTTTPDQETVTLTEDGENTGVFKRVLHTRYADSTPQAEDHVLSLKGNDSYVVTYVDTLDAAGRVNQTRTATGKAAVGSGATFGGGGQTTIVAGQPIVININDQDASASHGGPGFIIVTITTSPSGDTETINVPENPNQTGNFTASVPTEYGAGPHPGDKIVQVHGGDTITITYIVPLNGSGQTNQPLTETITVTAGSTASFGTTETSIIAGQPLHLSLTDGDLHSAAQVTITTTLPGGASGDSETVTLNPGSSPGTFTQTVQTAWGSPTPSTQSDGKIQVKGGDTVQITYTDAVDADGKPGTPHTVTIPVLAGHDGTVSIPSSLKADEGIVVTVTDPDLVVNTGPGALNTVEVTVKNTTNQDTETLSLVETGNSPHTGVFRGSLFTTYTESGQQHSGDSRLEVKGNDQFQAIYVDALTADGRTNVTRTSATGSVATAPTATVDVGDGHGGGGGSTTIRVGDPVNIYIVDPAANHNPGLGNDHVIATVTVTRGGQVVDQVVKTVGEGTSPGQEGIFIGQVPTEYNETSNRNDQTLQIVGGDIITITYIDPLNGNGQTNVPITITITVEAGGTGILTIAQPSILAGQPFQIHLADSDLHGKGPITVPLTTSEGITRSVTLQEGAQPGVFTATIQTQFNASPASSGGNLQVKGGDQVTVTYTDALDGHGLSNQVRTAKTQVREGTDGTLTGPSTILSDQGLALAIVDADQNTNPQLRETVQVQVKDARTGETRTVPLTETDLNTGRFEGTLQTLFDTGVVDPARLRVKGDDTLTATYTDTLSGNGEANVRRTLTATVEKGITAKFASLPSQIAAGEPLPVTVIDPDASGTLNVLVTTSKGSTIGDTVTLPLKETDPGTFTGSLKTDYSDPGQVVSGDETLQLQGGETISVKYTDPLDGVGRTNVPLTATVKVAAGDTALLTLRPTLLTAGENLTLTLADNDLKGTGTTTLKVTAAPTGSYPGEVETITLQESATPGRFTATIPTEWVKDASGLKAGDGKLQVQGDVKITVEYVDALNKQGQKDQHLVATSTVQGGHDGLLEAPSTLRAGEDLTLKVTDPDRNLSPTVKDTLSVHVVNSTNGDDEKVTLTETDVNTGIFTTIVGMPWSETKTPGNRRLEVRGGDRLVITYTDQFADGGQPNVTRTVNAQVLSGHDGTLKGPATFNVGDALTLEINDLDLSKTTGGSDGTFDLEVQSSSGGKATAHFQETSTAGQFIAHLPTEFPADAQSGDGKLQVKARDTVTAKYVDALDALGKTKQARAYRASLNSGTAATLRFLESLIAPGESAHLELKNAGLAHTADPVTVTVETAAGDQMTLTLTESSTAGVFTADVPTTLKGQGATSNALPVLSGQQVTAIYVNPIDDQGRVNQKVTAALTIQQGRDGELTGPATIAPGQAIAIQVTDADLTGTTTVTVTNTETGEVEKVTLKETKAGSGIFTGTLPTTYGKGAGQNNAGHLTLKPGAKVKAVYHDTLTAQSNSQDRVLELTVTGQSLSHQFPQGRQMISVPAKLFDPKVNSVLGANGGDRKMATYKTDGADRGYHIYDPSRQDPVADALQPGVGYFALFSNSAQNTLAEFGDLLPQNQPYTIVLHKGWNLIGSPFLNDTAWSVDAIKIRANGVEKPIRQAALDGWVVDYAWGMENGVYQLVADPSANLPGSKPWIQAFNGYWVLSAVDGEMILPPPAGPAAATVGSLATRNVRRGARSGLDGWALTLGVQRGDLKDHCVLGTAVASAAGVQIPKPPAFPSTDQLMISILGDGAGSQVTAMAYDLRSAAQAQSVWNVQVQSSATDLDSTLTWSDLNQVPKNVRMILLDKTTGQKQYMRTTSGYRIPGSRQPQARMLQIIAEPATQGLQVMGLSTNTGGSGVVMKFSLNQSAQVAVTVLGLNGKPIRKIAHKAIGVQGLNTATWDGRDDEGRSVPAGFYLLQLTAETDIGEVAKNLLPVYVRP